jgi:hypothetical protein
VGHTPQSALTGAADRADLASPLVCLVPRSLGYSGLRPPAWWYLAELPQGRKAARAGELFQVRGGSSHVTGAH